MNGAAMSTAGSNVSAGDEARIAGVEDPRVLLVDDVRIVAHPLQLVRRRRPGAMQVDARFVEERCPVGADPDAPVGRRRADHARGETGGREARQHRGAIRGTDLDDGARAPRRTAPRADRRRPRRARCRGRSATRTPFRQASRTARRRRCRDRRAARPSAASACTAAKNAASRAGSSTSGASSPSWPYTCASADPPRRRLPRPRSIQTSTVSPPSRDSTRRQHAPHVRHRRERGHDQRQRRGDRLVDAARRATSCASTSSPCRPEC